MNKSVVKQKRSIGKISPLSKRPKLDFTLANKDLSKGSNHSEKSPNSCKKVVKDKPIEKEKNESVSTSDWDDDFSGDMLERVCIIADLSQAMVNSQPEPELEKEKINFPNKKVSPKAQGTHTILEKAGSFEQIKQELEKLQEKLKTKEGEVHILRSQLKQNEDAKQASALQNIKVVEEIQEKYIDKINSIEKELESTKSKLLFRDLEYKTLSERCRQLEYNVSKSKHIETLNISKQINCLSQVTNLVSQMKEGPADKCTNDSNENDKCVKFEYFTSVNHEGKNLAKMLCPEFFEYAKEPSVVPFYSYCSEIESCKNKVDKAERYKWSDLPKPTAHIKDIYKDVGSLFICENFTQKEAIETIQTIINTCEKILHHQDQVFKFLDKLQMCNIEYEKADRSLLDDEEEVEMLTIKNIFNSKKLNKEECGIELRRSLGLLFSLIKVSETAFDIVKSNTSIIRYFKDIVASIGKLRRPLRYCGALVSICFILQKLVEEKSLSTECSTLIIETVEELIFARPKLNVLREVINVLAAGKHHVRLLGALCRRESVDSCMLYMDCKLKQAMFFSKNACPLQLLCMQIMGLACLPCNRNIRWDLTSCMIKWLNNSLSTENSKTLKWLPTCPGFMEEDRCFNVAECLLYLLVLCLNDYNLYFLSQDCFDDDTIEKKNEMEKKKDFLMSVIGQGAVLFKRILRADQRQLHENSYSLRFSILLKGFLPSKSNLCQTSHASLSSVEIEAISWINDLLESDLRVQECCLKQNISAISDADVFEALKINDETRIF